MADSLSKLAQEINKLSNETKKKDSEIYKLQKNYLKDIQKAKDENEEKAIKKEFDLHKKKIQNSKKELEQELSITKKVYDNKKEQLNKFKRISLATAGIIGKGINSVFSSFGLDFSSIFSDIGSNFKSMMNEAVTFSTGTSLISNAAAREQQMKYGLSSGQNYALTQSMDMLGMKSEEDLMYMNSAQREKFTEFMDKYSSWYDEMESSGVLENIQEVQLEFKMFKQEIAMKFLNWIAQNKEPIMKVLNGTMDALMWILDVISNLPGFKGSSNLIAPTVDSVGSSISTTTSNVRINQTNNVTSMLNNANELNSFLDTADENLMRSYYIQAKAL